MNKEKRNRIRTLMKEDSGTEKTRVTKMKRVINELYQEILIIKSELKQINKQLGNE